MKKIEGSGRQKGTPNKKTKDLFEMVDKLGRDPFEVLMLFVANDWQALGYSTPLELKPEMRLTAAKEACKYLYPQRKAIEHSADEDKGFKVILEDYRGKK